ncbi:MAG TPA: hypothetical protein PK431_03030 [Chitinophagales bacterium]|jgi:hypothetical protein|nr:hypothetical protein [Chitinophagales bacterium]
MAQPKRNSKLWLYLQQHAVDTADKQAMDEMKKRFYREYNTELKRKKRKDKRLFHISFPKSEIQHIRHRAKHYNTDVVGFVKLLVKAEINQNSVIENSLVYKEILQLLQHFKIKIEAIEAKENSRWLGNNNYESLYKILESIRDKILIKKK